MPNNINQNWMDNPDEQFVQTLGQNRSTYDTVTGDFSPVSTLIDSDQISTIPFKGGNVAEYLGDSSKYDENISRQNIEYESQFRGENQSGFAQLGSAINQALVGQIVGGTIQGVGYLLDLPQYVDITRGSEKEFTNWFSELGKSLQTWSEESTPIYKTYEEGSFSPDHWSWWMSNAPSVASTLSLVIPAAGAVRGLSMLGKVTKIGDEMGVTARWATKGITQAIVSRHMESMMDANQTYEGIEGKALDAGMTPEEAKKKASIGAASVYRMEWASLVQDIPQYLLLNKSFSRASLDNTIDIARKMGKSIAPVIGKKTAAIGWDLLTEGGEEAFQYIAQKEGEYIADKAYDPSIQRSFGDRLQTYLADGDLWTQGFFGAMGAGVTQTAGKVINKAITGHKDPRIEDIQSWGSQFSFWNQRMKEAQTDGDTNAERFTKDALWSTLGTKAASVGNSRNATDFLEAMKNPTPDELERFGVNEDDLKVFQTEIPKGLEKIKRIEKIYNDNSKKYNPDKAQLVTYHEALLEDQINNKNRLQGLVNQDRSMIPNLDILPPHVRDYIFHDIDSKLIRKRIKFFEKALNRSESESEKLQYQKNIDDLNRQLKDKETTKDDIKLTGEYTKSFIDKFTPKLTSKSFEDYRKHTQELEYSKHAISDLQSDLQKIISDDYLSTLEEKTKYEQQVKEEQEENKVYEPSIDDAVVYTSPIGDTSLHRITEVDEDDNAIISPVDETGLPIEGDNLIVDRKNLTLYHKEGVEELNQPEPINWDETPEVEKKLYDESRRGLRDVSASISHSNWDENQKKTIVRNKAFDIHVSAPSNELKGDRVSFSIDTNVVNVSTDEKYRKTLEKATKTINNKINKGESFSTSEINNIVNSIRETAGEDKYNSLVDIIPIKISYHTEDGQVFDSGLYYHDSNFIHQLSGGGWNIYISSDVEDVAEYVRNERDKVRQNRKILLTALLSGKEVILHNIQKTMGIPNNTNVNRHIDEVLKQDYNTIRLGIADSTDKVWSGHNSPDMKGHGTPGNIFFETNKTCNGETGTIKCNVSKVSPEHAGILWDVLMFRSHRGSGGNQAIYKSDNIEGLTVGQVIKLITTFGPSTNISHPNKVGKSYLINKQFYIDNKLILHYGENTVDLHDILGNKIDVSKEREKFINWAIKNKNYNISKEIPELGIELNKPMKKKFKLGSWVSEGKDTYTGFLIKNGIVQTDVQEFENTRSLFHAPVTIIDISESGYEAITAKPIIKKAKEVAKDVKTQSNKPSKNPKNTGTKIITPTETGEVKVSPEEIDKLKSLPIGSNIYINIHSKVGADEAKEIITPTLVLSVVDDNGTKAYQIKSARLRTAFGISIESYEQDPEPIVEISDQSASKVSTILTNYKDYTITVPKIEVEEKTIEERDEEIADEYRSLDKADFYGVAEQIKEYETTTKLSSEKIIDDLRSNKIKYFNLDEEGFHSLSYGYYQPEDTIEQKIVDVSEGYPEIDVEEIKKGHYYVESNTGRDRNVTEEYAKKLIDNYLDTKSTESKPNEIIPELKTEEPTEKLNIITINPFDINPGDEAPFKLAYTVPFEYEIIDLKKELKWLHDKLGDIPVEIIDGIIYNAKTGKRAFGQLRRNGILLSNVAETGTIYHEAYHQVSLLALDKDQRKKIYDEAQVKYEYEIYQRYGKRNIEWGVTERQIEEVLADKFREYVINKNEDSNYTLLGKIGEFFKNLYILIKRVFTGPDRLTNLDIDKLFKSIEFGKFKTYKPLRDNLDILGSSTYELEYRDRQLDNITNFKMFRSVIRGLSSIVMKDVSSKLFKTNEPNITKYDEISDYRNISYEESRRLSKVLNGKVFYSTSQKELISAKNLDEYLDYTEKDLERQTAGGTHAFFEYLDSIQITGEIINYGVKFTKENLISKLADTDIVRVEYDPKRTLRDTIGDISKRPILTEDTYLTNINNAIRSLTDEIGNVKITIPELNYKGTSYNFLGLLEKPSKYAAVDVVDSIKSINFKDLRNRIELLINGTLNNPGYNDVANACRDILNANEKGQIDSKLASRLNDLYKVDNMPALIQKAHYGLENALRLASLYQEVLDNYDLYKDAVEEYIHTELGIRKVNNEDEDKNVDNRELARYSEESYERSAKDTIPNSIKFLVSNLHEYGEVDQTTGFHKFVEFDEIWSRLMNDLHSMDKVEDMINFISTKNDYFPYQQLAKKLKNGSEILRSQFYQAMHRHRHSFINGMFKETKEKGKQTNFNIYFTDADVQNAAKNVITNWSEAFASSDLFTDDKLDEKKLQKIFDDYTLLKKSYESDQRTKPLINTTEYKDRLISILKDIHIDVDNKTIDDLISEIINNGRAGTEEKALSTLLDRDLQYLFSKDSSLYKYAKGEKVKIFGTLAEPKTLFKDESRISRLAESFAKTNYGDISDNLPGAEGHNNYVFSENSYTTDVIHYLKTDDNYLKTLLSDVHSKHSYYLNQLSEDKTVRNNLKIGTFNAFIKDSTPDLGRNYLDITPVEDFLYKLNLIRSGYFVFPTIASRRTYYMLKGLKRIEVKYQKEGDSLRLPDEIINIFYSYALAEKNRIDNAWKTVEKYSKLDENGNIIKGTTDFTNLVENYHYLTEGKVKNISKGLAYKYQYMFHSFNRKGFDIYNEEVVKNEIRDILENDIKETIKFAAKDRIIDSTKNILSSILIDNGMVTEVSKEYGGDKNAAIRSIIADYTINTKISSIETMMMFMGDVAFYNQDNTGNPAEDYAKRLSVLTSSGSTPREIIPVDYESPIYNVTTLSEQKLFSTYYDAIRKKQKELLLPKYNNNETLVDKILDKVLRDYKRVSPTDAQVLITPDMFRGDSIRIGKWNDKIEEAFNLLQSNEPISAIKEQQLLDIVMQPLKHVYFDRVNYDIDDNNKVLIPTYDKMAIFTLFRRYVNGTHLEELLDRMEAKGKYEGKEKIDMVKFDTAVKVGNRLRTDYFKNPDTDTQSINDLTNLPVYYQRFKFLRNQTATDPHEIQKVLLASQFKKITLVNIEDDVEYIVNGKPTNGKDLKNNVTRALISLSDKETHKLLDKLGVDENGEMDNELFYDTLLADAKVSGMPENVQESLRKRIPIDLLPERKWILQRFAALVNKYGIDVHLPGQQLIQMSGFGLGSKSITDETNNLKFLFDDKNKDNPKIVGTECKVSVQVFKDVIPGYDNKSWEDKVKWLKDNPEVLEGIGYRIPNQGQGSSIFLKIKEFLPESSGDVIILPNEFTALTGSDFDVDKVFLIRYNYRTDKDGKVSKVPFMTDENSTVDQRYDKILNEAFYDNKYIFSRESYTKLQEVRDSFYNSIALKSRLLGENGTKLSTLFDLRKELSKRLNESSDKEKEFYHRQLLILDSRIDDIIQYNNVINETSEDLKEFRKDIEETLVSHNLIPSREEFKKLHTNGDIDYFQQNTKQSIQNYYLDNIKAILLSEQHFLSTSAPLEAITDRLKVLAGKVRDAEETGKEKSLDFTGPVYQSNLKFKFASGTLGKGSFSLSNSHHVISQLANISFNRDIGIGKTIDGKTSLYEKEGVEERDGQKILISDWGSALIDSQVDIEKDPYIIDLNVVQPTYNVVQLLTRLGFGEKTFEFTSQPILKDLAREYINEITENNELGIRRDKPIEIIRDRWNDLYISSLKKFTTKELRDNEDARIKSKYSNYKPLEDDLLRVLQDPIKDSEWIYKQLQIVELFHKLDKGAARDLNRLVMASRVDTKKWGNNLTETKMYIDSIRDLYDEKLFTNLDKLLPFDPETQTSDDVEDGTFNSAYLRNGPLLFTKLMANKTFTASKPFNDLISRIMILTKNKYARNKEGLMNHIADELHGAFLSRFFSDKNLLNLDSKKIGSIMGKVVKFLTDVNSNPKYKDLLKDNVLIQSLIKGKNTVDGLVFFGIPTIKADDNFVKEDLTFAWQELLQSDDINLRNFARELFVYSFYTSGFKRGPYSIFHYIPPSLFKELEVNYNKEDGTQSQEILDFSEFVDGILLGLQDQGLVNSMITGIDKEVFKNNWYNPKYVRQLYISDLQNIIQSSKTKHPVIGTIGTRDETNRLYLGDNEIGQPIFRPYINYNTDDKTSYLMEYIGFHSDRTPVYKLVGRMGFYNKGRIVKEYGLEQSMFKRNQVIEVSDSKIIDILSKDPMYSTFEYVQLESRDIVLNKRSSEEVQEGEGLQKDIISMKVVSNQRMAYKMPANDNLTGKDTSTLELTEQGLRTATTRSFPLGAIGDIITFEGRPYRYRITNVELLTEDKVTNPEWIEQWSQKEQWTTEHFEKILGGKTVHIGSFQTSFEKLEQPTTVSGFQGYQGGFENKGKGTPEGDGKDKVMRQVADGFIGEIVKTNSSSQTSRNEIINKTNIGEQSQQLPTSGINIPIKDMKSGGRVIMLARNSEFKDKELLPETQYFIKNANMSGSEFVVGDTPNVDSQFIDYLQEIGAKFTIYHTGSESRIKINKPINSNLQSEIESLKSEISESGVYTEDQIKEFNNLIDNTEINSVEDLNKLINKICNK